MSQLTTSDLSTYLRDIETLTGDFGAAVGPNASGNIDIEGGTNIATTGTPGSYNITIELTGATDHAVQVGNSINGIDSLAIGNDNEVLIGNTLANPSWGQVPNLALSNSSVTLNNGNNITVTGSPLSLGGVASFDVTGCTQYALQVGNATGSLDSLAVGTDNQILLGDTTANPYWGSIAGSGAISVSVAAGTITISGGGTS